MNSVAEIPSSIEILQQLISFDTTSANPNMALMTYVSDLLKSQGIEPVLVADETASKANLYATVGGSGNSGIMLSGHSDVVPVEGQAWTRPAFRMTREGTRLYGRGTTDMKGFVASAIHAALKAAQVELATPLHLAFSYDEEIGCVGVHSLIDMLAHSPVKPAMCIVGEPTGLTVATGHKGKVGMIATCIGQEAHSSLAPHAVNAIHLASDFITALRNLQQDIEQNNPRDEDYDVPYSTLHVGKINGGVALNIVPNQCRIAFEIRNIAEDDPQEILARIRQEAQAIVEIAKERFSGAEIAIEVFNSYPGLSTEGDHRVVEFVKSLTGANHTCKVAFGTEGGLFSQKLGIPTVVCGPGSMAQGHKPDEYIEIGEMEKCDAMLARLVEHLKIGL